MLQELAKTLLHGVHGIGAVLSHGLEAIHGGHGGHFLSKLVGGLHIEDFLEHAHLLKGLAPLFQEHADRSLGFPENTVLEAGSFRKCNTCHIVVAGFLSFFPARGKARLYSFLW